MKRSTLSSASLDEDAKATLAADPELAGSVALRRNVSVNAATALSRWAACRSGGALGAAARRRRPTAPHQTHGRLSEHHGPTPHPPLSLCRPPERNDLVLVLSCGGFSCCKEAYISSAERGGGAHATAILNARREMRGEVAPRRAAPPRRGGTGGARADGAAAARGGGGGRGDGVGAAAERASAAAAAAAPSSRCRRSRFKQDQKKAAAARRRPDLAAAVAHRRRLGGGAKVSTLAR